MLCEPADLRLHGGFLPGPPRGTDGDRSGRECGGAGRSAAPRASTCRHRSRRGPVGHRASSPLRRPYHRVRRRCGGAGRSAGPRASACGRASPKGHGGRPGRSPRRGQEGPFLLQALGRQGPQGRSGSQARRSNVRNARQRCEGRVPPACLQPRHESWAVRLPRAILGLLRGPRIRAIGGSVGGVRRRSDRPKRRTVALRASVGSTEAAKDVVARVGRIDRSSR
jgi:hypothetical protein